MKNLKREQQESSLKQWLFVIGGMAVVLAGYLIYASYYGSNVTYNQTMSITTPGVTILTSSETSADSKAYLGVQVLPITDELAENLQLKSKIGVLIGQVFPNSPAQKAGLKHGDVIVAYNNRTVKDLDRFRDLLAESNPGDTVRIVYLRDGKKDSTYATLTVFPSSSPTAPLSSSSIVKTSGVISVDSASPAWGVSLVPLTSDLKATYSLPSGVNGIVILSVEEGSVADKAGLSVGDVIVGVNQTPVTNMEDLLAVIAKDNDTIAILDIYSDGRTRYITIDTSSLRATTIVDTPAAEIAGNVIDALSAVSPFGNVETLADESTLYIPKPSLLSPGNLQFFLPWIPVIGVLGLVFAGILYFKVKSASPGDAKMQRIAEKIRSGAFVFLNLEYKLIYGFVMGVFLLLRVFYDWTTATAFVIGAACSLLAGWIGIKASTQANVRTTQAAKSGLWPALEIAFQGGAVMGISVAALGVVGLGVVCLFLQIHLTSAAAYSPMVLVAFSLGASLVAMFARVGGGIFTKSADIGSDLVGKLELGIPEDDYRNPGVIADNVGDCVGDTAGMGADLFESYVGAVVSAITVGFLIANCLTCVFLPLLLICEGLLASVIAVAMLRTFKNYSPQAAIRTVTLFAGIIFLVAAFITVLALMGDLRLFWVVCIGVFCGLLIGWQTEIATSGQAIRSIAHAAKSGSATTIITGFSRGFKSLIFPILTNCAAIFFSYKIGGLYGIAMAAIGMSALIGIVMSADSYGPISDNAGGIAEMAGLDPDVRAITDELDSVGNTTAAAGKGFAVSSAALTALSFFAAYLAAVGLKSLDISNPSVSVGMIIGSMVPFAIASLTMDSVNRVAQQMVVEIRKQFRTIVGLKEGKAEPDSDRCIAIVTKGALQEISLPGVTAVLLPLVIGIFMGKYALGGFLMGAIISGVILGIWMANAGAAWDNAKKFIEKGYYGGKGSSAHHAAIIGDTVGDPLKDTAGPSLNILIKLMALVAVLFASFIR